MFLRERHFGLGAQALDVIVKHSFQSERRQPCKAGHSH